MKKKKIIAALATLTILSGCSNNGNSDTTSDSTNGSVIENSAPVVSTPYDAHPESVNDKSGIPEEISDYISSLDNGDFVFVDYTFDEDPETVTFIPSLNNIYGKALAALQETDDYKNFAENYGGAELFGRFTENTEDYLDQNGEPMPIFKRAITDDFDGDGADESFVMMAIAKIPDDNSEERWFEREYLFFVDENGTELLDDYYNADIRAVLDYGCCKQVIVSSKGWSGTDSKSNIWGVQDGNAVKLYGGRLDFSKTDCFLYSTGQQLIGDFAVYDIDKGEYLAIQGKELTSEDIRAMDTDNVIGSKYDEILSAVLIGGKYFVVNNGVYTYENGKFERSDKLVRSSATPGITGDALNTLADVDYDAAVASMTAPENIGENSTSGSDEKMSYQLHDEIFLDQKLLKSIEQDRLDVMVNLHIDEEALRAEYEERYPELVEDYYSWGRFLSSSGNQVIEEFVLDYDIDYEELESVFKMGASFYYELDKDTISSMLNDARVAEIIYYVGGYPVIVDF